MAKIDTALSGDASLIYGTYVGGESLECEVGGEQEECAIAVDANGAVYLAGPTISTLFPVSTNAYDNSLTGFQDAFVIKLNPVGNGVNDRLYGTYLGGSGAECTRACSIVVDGNKNIYVTGQTTSGDLKPTATAFQKAYGGGDYDGFVTVFKAGAGGGSVNNYQLLSTTE